jgi:hypothetical protein
MSTLTKFQETTIRKTQTLKKAKKRVCKLLAAGLACTLSASMLLTGCGKNDKTTEVVMTDDDEIIRDTLLESFEAMASVNSMRISISNTYTLKMRVTQDGIQMDVDVDSNYTSTVLLKRGIGFGMSVENDYTTNVSTVSTDNNYSESDTAKSAYVTFYDEPNDTYYYTLGEDDDTTWYRSTWDGDQMAKDFYDAVKDAPANYTMETLDTTYKITFDYGSLSETDSMQAFFDKYEEDMNAIDEYMDILACAKNGMATFIINKDTMLLDQITVSNVVISSDAAKDMIGDDADEMVIGDMSMSADITVNFTSYDDVTDDDMAYYKNRIQTSIDADEVLDAEAEESIDLNVDEDEDGTKFFYESDSLSDTHNVSDYEYEDIKNEDLNNIRFIADKDYESLYIKPNRVINYGWEYQTPEDDSSPVTFTNSQYPGAMLVLLKESDETTYSDMIDNGAIGLEINVLNCAYENIDLPDMEFTDYNIKFGMLEADVLEKMGKPDVVYIGMYYTQYQYSTYSLSTYGEIDTVSVVFTFYHVDDINGLYDVDIERYSGSAVSNVGNKDVSSEIDTTEESED